MATYVVERSFDSRSFTAVGNVAARNILIGSTYSYIDESNLPAIAYYRIKSVNKNGSFAYSKVVLVSHSDKGKLTVYPNPVSSVMNVLHDIAERKSVLELYASNGKLVFKNAVSENATRTTLDISKLQAGSYTLKMINGASTSTVQIVKE